jgi:hypothetical protein
VQGQQFQENLSQRLQETLQEPLSVPPPADERQVRIFCEDERRVGLLPVPRRRITLTGVKPLGAVQYHCENFYVYGAVEPTTGASFFLELPDLDTTNFQIVLNEFAPHYQATLNLVIMANGSCHKAKSLSLPRNIGCLFLPL